MIRRIIFYRDYFLNFFSQQDEATQRKIEFTMELIRSIERVPIKFFKYLEGTDALYEIRVRSGKKQIRIISFLDEGNLVILINSFVKKSMKIPKKEIDLAERLKKKYFNKKLKGESL
jgi:phage-related protein